MSSVVAKDTQKGAEERAPEPVNPWFGAPARAAATALATAASATARARVATHGLEPTLAAAPEEHGAFQRGRRRG